VPKICLDVCHTQKYDVIGERYPSIINIGGELLEETARQSRPNRSSVVNTPCLSRSLVGVFVLDRCRSKLLGLHHEKVQNGDYFKSER